MLMVWAPLVAGAARCCPAPLWPNIVWALMSGAAAARSAGVIPGPSSSSKAPPARTELSSHSRWPQWGRGVGKCAAANDRPIFSGEFSVSHRIDKATGWLVVGQLLDAFDKDATTCRPATLHRFVPPTIFRNL